MHQRIFILRNKSRLRGLRRGPAAARLLRLWVWIPPGPWMSVYCECCVLSGRDLCDEPITCPEESHRLWCVVVCDLETSWMRRPWPSWGCRAKKVKGKGRFMGLFQHCGRSTYCILTPNKFPHSYPEAPRIIQMIETSTSEGGNYYQWILLANP